MDERLLSRFKWGLSADLNTPDFDTRVSILENKMYQDGITLNRDVVEYLAHNIDTNVRELEGALISLLAQASLTRKQARPQPRKANREEFRQEFYPRNQHRVHSEVGL